MSDLLADVQEQLWAPAGMDLVRAEGLMSQLLEGLVDLGELFFQRQKEKIKQP